VPFFGCTQHLNNPADDLSKNVGLGISSQKIVSVCGWIEDHGLFSTIKRGQWAIRSLVIRDASGLPKTICVSSVQREASMYNYFALSLVAFVGIVAFDDDPTGVSPQEWILYAVLLYAAVSFFRRYLEHIRQQIRRGG